jgi:hypothetical protein
MKKATFTFLHVAAAGSTQAVAELGGVAAVVVVLSVFRYDDPWRIKPAAAFIQCPPQPLIFQPQPQQEHPKQVARLCWRV